VSRRLSAASQPFVASAPADALRCSVARRPTSGVASSVVDNSDPPSLCQSAGWDGRQWARLGKSMKERAPRGATN